MYLVLQKIHTYVHVSCKLHPLPFHIKTSKLQAGLLPSMVKASLIKLLFITYTCSYYIYRITNSHTRRRDKQPSVLPKK